MHRKILCILVLMLLFSSIFPIVGSSRIFDDVIDQEQPIWTENEGYGIHNSNEKMAQSLKPTLNTLTRVQLVAGNFGSPSGNLFISIRDSLNGDDLASASISVHNIPPLEQSDWIEFDFSDISVIPEKSYYIIWHADELWNSSNFVIWRKHGDDPYLKGRLFWYNGLEWVDEYPTEDFCFRTYGLNNQPPNTPIINGPTSGKVGEVIDYEFTAVDPDGDELFYYIEFEEGIGYWTDESYPSEESISRGWRWFEQGTYTIRSKVRDVHGLESEWATLEVSMPKNQAVSLVEVSIIQPWKGTLYLWGMPLPILPSATIIIGNITVLVSAISLQLMDKLEFYVDDELKYTETNPAVSWQLVTWDWDEKIFFKHTLKVVAYDKGDNTASDEIDVRIFNI